MEKEDIYILEGKNVEYKIVLYKTKIIQNTK